MNTRRLIQLFTILVLSLTITIFHSQTTTAYDLDATPLKQLTQGVGPYITEEGILPAPIQQDNKPSVPFPQPETWVAGKTSVSDLSLDEQRRLCGVPLENLEENLSKARQTAPMATTVYDYPPIIDWRNVDGQDWTTPIRDQGGCGSCVAHGTLGAVESRQAIFWGDPILQPDLSEAHLFFCGCGNCCGSGWYGQAAMNYLKTVGVVDEACFPYTPNDQPCSPCSDWQTRVTNIVNYHGMANSDDAKQAIANLGPIEAGMRVYEDFFSYQSGVYRHAWGDPVGGHSITIVGYNDLEGHWIAKNSWGTGWGEDGWFRIAYDENISPNYMPMLVCDDLYEPNDTWRKATEVTLGASLNADICQADDTDFYAITVAAGDQIMIDVDAQALNSSLDGYLQVLDVDGVTEMAANNDANGLDPALIYTFPADGAYYIALRDNHTPSEGGSDYFYTLNLRSIPDIDIQQISIQAEVQIGELRSSTFAVENYGTGYLAFETNVAGSGFTPDQPSPLIKGRTIGHFRTADQKEERHIVTQLAAPGATTDILHDGGPDDFGYIYRDSHENDGPSYQWIEIAPPAGGHGIELSALTDQDDGYYWPLSLPFAFDFYGGEYTDLAINTNGTIYFEDDYLGLVSHPIPSDNGEPVKRFIAPLWDDLVITPGAVYYQDLGSMFVIEFHQVSGCCLSPDPVTWEVILFKNGNILFQYQDVVFGDWRDKGANAAIGIQGDKQTGLQYSYATPALSSNMSICFAYPGQSPNCWNAPWLSVEPDAGTVAVNESIDIEVTLDAGVSEVSQPGEYYATLIITSNDPDESIVQIPVTMTVPIPSDWGRIEGTVLSRGYCDASPAPLRNAEVIVTGRGDDWWLLTTDGSGKFDLWLDTENAPLTLAAVHDEYATDQASGINLIAGQTTVWNSELRWWQPCVSVTPAQQVEADVALGKSVTRTLTISNTGAAPADFALAEFNALGDGANTQHDQHGRHAEVGQVWMQNSDKVSRDLYTPPLIQDKAAAYSSSGGPDAFGYTFTDSTEFGGAFYRWIELAPSAGGHGAELNALANQYDSYYWPLSLPFTFDFYGSEYTDLAINTNGTIYFEDEHLGLNNHPIPGDNGEPVKRFIAPLWNDLVMIPSAVYYQDLGSMFVIEFYQALSCCPSPNTVTWEVIFFKNGNILIQYQDAIFGDVWLDNGARAAVGIQRDEHTGLQYSYMTPALSSNMSICFAYPGESANCSQDISWLASAPVTGEIVPGEHRTIEVTFDAGASDVTGLGDYQGLLMVATNDPITPHRPVTVTMHVVEYSVGVDSVAGQSGGPGDQLTYQVRLTNSGMVEDRYTVTLSGQNWPTAAPALVGPVIAGGDAIFDVEVTIPYDAHIDATDVATVTVTSHGDDGRFAEVTLTTTVDTMHIYMPVVFVTRGP